jgi:hypothetical protein
MGTGQGAEHLTETGQSAGCYVIEEEEEEKKIFVLIQRTDVSNADKALRSLSTLWVQTRAAQGQLTVKDWCGVKS